MKQHTCYIVNLLCSCLLLIFVATGMVSCKKFVSIPPPVNQVVATTVFTDDATATSAVAGLYSQLMISNSFFLNGGITQLAGLSADEFYNTNSNTSLDEFTANALSPSNSINRSNLWARAYSHIYQANACLEGLDASLALTPALKQQLTGEVRFIRALCYWYLVNLYGEVPLIISTDYKLNAAMPRNTLADLYDQIVADLKEAENLLQPAYPVNDRTRANKWAASALLARAYLYKGDWINAEDRASAVVDAGPYTLTALNNAFLATSPETVLQFYPVLSGVNTAEGFLFLPSSATVRPAYALTASLVNAFEPGDNRKTAWVKANTVNAQVFYYPYKYKVRSNSSKTEYNVVFRLAEQYLLRAEARARQNKLPGAIADLDAVRTRAGLPHTTANDQSSLLAAIEKERRVELFTEWGHRWFNLKRTGSLNSVMAAEKQGWQPKAALFPVPYTEMQRNPFLTQNPGYQ